MKRTRREYGGFLPLELNEGKEYYKYSGAQMQRFNCAKAAAARVIECESPKAVYLPYYMCPNVCREVERHGMEVNYYHIDGNLMPCGISDEEGACIYLTDYFGIMDAAVTEYAEKLKKAAVSS